MLKTPTLQELLEAGVHFGHQVRRGHPRMKPYIYGARDGVHIIDLTKSDQFLKEACDFVYNLGKMGKSLLFVGTKKQARSIVEEAAESLEVPYFTERWVGGYLTNFDEVLKNIKKLKDLKQQKEKGELKKYTKKEQLLIDRKIANLERDYKGVVDFETLPDVLFVVDAVSDNIAIREARRMGITVVSIADSNSNPVEIDYPIPGNDDAIKSIKILVDTISSAYGEGKKEAGKIKLAAEKKEEKQRVKDEMEVKGEIAAEVEAAEEKVEKEAVKEAERIIE
ncbi:MAG: 30S ribosomal protein S2 [Candidatus Daviesbacteria bacterium]|nr:30S ribosomal protein S2 [Candidatus Daviesbacteria bacterium]